MYVEIGPEEKYGTTESTPANNRWSPGGKHDLPGYRSWQVLFDI
jgi:hypothetical protein